MELEKINLSLRRRRQRNRMLEKCWNQKTFTTCKAAFPEGRKEVEKEGWKKVMKRVVLLEEKVLA